MVKLRHTFLISILFHAGIFALMSPLVLSLGEAGKNMTKQLIVELVQGVSKKVSLSIPISAKTEDDKTKEEQVKKIIAPKVQKKVTPEKKLKAPVAEPVIEAAAEKEIMEEVFLPSESTAVEKDPVSVEPYAQKEAQTFDTQEEESSMAELKKAENEASLFDKSANYSLILEKIEAAKWYPRVARKRGMEGVTVVKFRIAPDGNVQEIMIDEPSGFSILDKAAIKTIQRAAPFPFFDSLLKVAVAFKLT